MRLHSKFEESDFYVELTGRKDPTDFMDGVMQVRYADFLSSYLKDNVTTTYGLRICSDCLGIFMPKRQGVPKTHGKHGSCLLVDLIGKSKRNPYLQRDHFLRTMQTASILGLDSKGWFQRDQYNNPAKFRPFLLAQGTCARVDFSVQPDAFVADAMEEFPQIAREPMYIQPIEILRCDKSTQVDFHGQEGREYQSLPKMLIQARKENEELKERLEAYRVLFEQRFLSSLIK